MDLFVNNQIIYWNIYLIASVMIGSMLGIICVYALKTLEISVTVRFLFGFSCTPYVIGIYTLILSFIPVKLPDFLYVLPLIILAVIILWKKRKEILTVMPNKIFAGYSIEIRIALLGLTCYMFSNAVLKAVCNVITESILVHKNIVTGCFSVLFFGIFLVVLLRTEKNSADGLSIKAGIYYFLLSVIYFISCYLLSMAEMKIKGGQIFWGIKHAPIWIITVAGLAGLLFYIMTCLMESKKNTKRYGCRIAICYFIFMIIIMSEGLICWIIKKAIAIFKCLGTTQKIIVSLLGIGTVGILIIIGGHFAILIEKKIKNAGQDKMKETKSMLIQMLFMVIAIIILAHLIYLFADASFAPVIGADANQYMSEALAFAKKMNFSAMNNYKGSLDGALIANIHHPTWPAYLANALLFSGGRGLGFPNDVAVRLAFQMTYIYLFAAVWALGSMLKRKIVPYLGIVFMFMYRGMFLTCESASRDAFRLVPVVGLCILMLAMDKKIKSFDYKYALILFVNCAFVMMGHPINAITAIVIVVSYTLIMLAEKRINKNVVKYYIVAAMGALFGSYQMIMAFFETGKMTGVLIDLDKLLVGTDYYNNYMAYTEGRLQGTENYFERISTILMRDHGVLSVPGLICAIAVVVLFAKKLEQIKEIYFLSLIIVFNGLFLTDMFGWSGIRLTEWCVMNGRYTLQFYVFWGVEIACIMAIFVDRLVDLEWRKFVIFGMACWAYTLLPYGVVVFSYQNENKSKVREPYINSYIINKEIQGQLSGKRILIDNYYMNYYLDNQGLSFFTEPAWDIRNALTEPQLYDELTKKDVGAVLITDSFREVYWDNSLMEKFTKSEYIKECIDTDINKVYILK